MTLFEEFDIRSEIGPLLRRCDRRAADLYESAVDPDAPTRQQCGVLLVVHQMDDPTQAEISQRTGIDRSTVRGIVRRLAKRGLLEMKPAPNDHRAVAHSLTDEGLETLKKYMRVLVENQEKIIAPVPISLRPVFIECLQRVAGYEVRYDDQAMPLLDEVHTRPKRRGHRKKHSKSSA